MLLFCGSVRLLQPSAWLTTKAYSTILITELLTIVTALTFPTMTSAKFRLWAGSLTLAAISCFAVVVGVRAEVLPGVSADPQSGAERGPIITDGGSQSVWRQGNTDRGSGAMIVYKNTNPSQSLVLSAGH